MASTDNHSAAAAADSDFVAIDTPKSGLAPAYHPAAPAAGSADVVTLLKKVPKLSVEWQIDEMSVKIQKSRREFD
ncbi:hypothetical protein As57867_007209, partial [Aphanomyces stellatus]